MKLDESIIKACSAIRERVREAEALMEGALAPCEGIVEQVLARGDVEELGELLKHMPSCFWRAEIRGYLRQLDAVAMCVRRREAGSDGTV
jgi:hypothetical protein